MHWSNKMKKVLFIDRDGTLILEPEDEQIDSLEKLDYYPKVFTELSKVAKSNQFELVMVTNQDGLGTDSFPEGDFWPAHNKMMETMENEGISFDEVLIDRSFPHEKQPTRKPGTAMLSAYMTGDYDLENSFVIGDRLSDIALAKNLGCKGILMNENLVEDLADQQLTDSCAFISADWSKISAFLLQKSRIGTVKRKTNETDIDITVNLDGSGKAEISTGIVFFDHMLEQIAKHGQVDLKIKTIGDLEVDEHHTIEDTAIALGEAFSKALGDKRGIERYGFCLPMDDALAQVALDFGGRNWIVWEAEFKREMIGKMPTEMFYHFFKSFSDSAKCNLNISVKGDNEHHKIEGVFKAFAKALKMAVKKDGDQLPSTKGVL